MAWIEVHQSLVRHRKVMAAAIHLDIPRMTMIGHLVCLWTWALDSVPDGDLSNIMPSVIATAAEWPGEGRIFVNVLVNVGFLDKSRGHLQIHNWADYTGRLIARRAKNKERMRDARAEHVQGTDDARAGATVPYRTVPYRTVEYIHTLRGIRGWEEKGEPHVESLVEWVEKKGVTDDLLERSAIGLAKTKTSTLKGYENLARAFQDRINKGYDKAGSNGKDTDPAPEENRFEVMDRERKARRERGGESSNGTRRNTGSPGPSP